MLSLLPGNPIDGLFLDGILLADPGDKDLECWLGLTELSEQMDELGAFQFLEVHRLFQMSSLYADKLSMAHGFEVRVPYLDRDILEHVEKLSSRFKVHNGSRLWLHRRVSQTFPLATVFGRR